MVNAASAERIAWWAQVEVRRHALIEMAELLGRFGIELLVVKGLHLAVAVAGDPYRKMLDADALVVRGSFDDAVRIMASSSAWRIACADWSTHGIERTSTCAYIDLHRFALPLAFGTLDNRGLCRRASRMPECFGNRVLVPDPADAATIAIGNFVKDSVGVIGHGKLAEDLDLLAQRAGLRPDALAARLCTVALRKAGIVAFTAIAERDARWMAWLYALAPSRVEERTARALVRALLRFTPAHPDAAFLTVRSISDTMPRGALGFALTATRLLRDRVRRFLPTTRKRYLHGAL